MRENTRSFLRRHLDAYEDGIEKKDERYWSWVSRGMDALDDHQTLKRFFYSLLGLELIYWFLVLAFPFKVLHAFELIAEWSDKGAALVIGVVFGTGLYIAYVLFRFRFPDLENNEPGDGPVVAAYSQQRGLERKFRVWIASVVVGIVNFLALAAIEILRVGNGNTF